MNLKCLPIDNTEIEMKTKIDKEDISKSFKLVIDLRVL